MGDKNKQKFLQELGANMSAPALQILAELSRNPGAEKKLINSSFLIKQLLK